MSKYQPTVALFKTMC